MACRRIERVVGFGREVSGHVRAEHSPEKYN